MSHRERRGGPARPARRPGVGGDPYWLGPRYLDHVERHHPKLTTEALLRMAVTRETAVYALPGGIGRVVHVTQHGPEAVPVNFTVHEGAIAFHTAADRVPPT